MAPKNRAEYRDILASEFLQVLNEKGLQWKQGWNSSSPMNAVTKSHYHGINRFYLSMIALEHGYKDPRWATMVQIMDKQSIYHPREVWHLQAGSKAVFVEYWFPYDTQSHHALRWSEFRKLSATERADPRYILRARYTPVFHVSQIDGIPQWEPERRQEQPLDEVVNKLSRNMNVEILYDGEDQAFYRPSEDKIHLPKPAVFQNTYALNATVLHELAHATGHEKRLSRACHNLFGTPEYAYEELIAEISSCFMSITLQTEQAPEHINNHKAYVQSWIQAIQDKPETLIRAIKAAQHAANYMDYQADLISEQEYTTLQYSSMDSQDFRTHISAPPFIHQNSQEKPQAQIASEHENAIEEEESGMATLKIYQLKDSAENRVRRWMDYNGLGKLGEIPQLQNYDKVYSMQLLDNPTPEQVFLQFNQSRPADFTGHSLSTSDIIAFQGDTENIAYYVDSTSFVRLPELEQELTTEGKKGHEDVGFLRYLDSGETVNYTDADAFIAAYKEDLDYYGPNDVRAVILTKDLEVRYEIEKLLVGEFGEKLPDKETWIATHSNPMQNYCMEHQQQPEPDAEHEM